MLYVCARLKKWEHVNIYSEESSGIYYGVIDTDDGKVDFLQEEELKSIIKKYNLTIYSYIDAYKYGYPLLLDYVLLSTLLDKYSNLNYYDVFYDKCGEYGEFRYCSKDINDFFGQFAFHINSEKYQTIITKNGIMFPSESPYDSCDNIAEQCFKFKIDSIREFRKKRELLEKKH